MFDQLAPAERAAIVRRIGMCAGCRAAVEAAARTGPLATDPTAVQRSRATPSADRAEPGASGLPETLEQRGERTRGIRSAGRSDGIRPPGPAVNASPVVTLPLRGGREAPGEEVIELVGGRPPSTASDRPGAHRDARNAPSLPKGAAPVEGDVAPGEVVGRYVVERPIGAGGMGVVSLAHDPELRRPVVIKLVHPNMGIGEGGDELEARLRREAQAMAQVSHANVVQIFDIGRRGDRVFLAMEFIAGRTLDVWLAEKPRTSDEIIAMLRQAGAGLAAAHRAGLVHRDFKPSNVLVGKDEVAKVTDFGLARAVAGSGGPGSAAAGGAGATRQLRIARTGPVLGDAPTLAVTRSAGERVAPRPSGVHAVLTEVDSVVGTPAYMSPEQAAGGAIDARTDQYALAVTLLDALLGQSPSRRRISPGAPPSAIDAALDEAHIASPVREAIVRALSADPAARFPVIDELLRALAPPLRGRSRRAVLAIAGLALCAIAAGAWLIAQRAEPATCAGKAPDLWSGASRARAVSALSTVSRPFAGWDAERIAAAVDRAVDSLGAAEIAACRGEPLAGSAASAATPACIARRTAALSAAIDALSASPPHDDPWAVVAPIDQCDAPTPPATAALRAELRGATPARAKQIAATAHEAGDDRLAADALEAAGLAALSTGDAAAARSELLAMAAAGERAGDDSSRGRALLHLVEVARWRGEHADARRDLDELHAMLARHGNAPRDVLTVALAEAATATDLGDAAAAFAAWDHARGAAGQLDDRDAELGAALGHAWSIHVLRFDLPSARSEATAALTDGATAGPAARAEALAVVADLALAARDGAAAAAALAEAHRLVPSRASLPADRLRLLRTKALLGEVDAALAELAASPGDDALTAARVEVARGQILLAADRPGEARDVLEKVERDVRMRSKTPIRMAVPEHIELVLDVCEVQVQTSDRCKASYLLDGLLKDLHPRAPARARLALAHAASDSIRPLASLRSQYLLTALDILDDAGAPPLRLAELRWQIAQLRVGSVDHHRLATQAREAFQAAGRTAEVAEIDAWLGAADPSAPAAPVDASSSTIDPRPQDRRGPQP